LQLHLRSYLVLACWWRRPEGKWTRRGRLAAPRHCASKNDRAGIGTETRLQDRFQKKHFAPCAVRGVWKDTRASCEVFFPTTSLCPRCEPAHRVLRRYRRGSIDSQLTPQGPRMRKSLGAFSPTKAFDTSLKKQFEQQSEQVAVLLSSLQKVTIELEEARDSTKKQVADARQESKEALKAADARAAEVNDEMIALQKQHEDEVRREGRAHA